MQHAIGLDTLSFTKRLKTAGFDEQQAKVQAQAIKEILVSFQDKRLETLTTKDDLKAEISDVRDQIKELSVKLATTKTKMVRWVAGMMLAQVVAIVALLKFF